MIYKRIGKRTRIMSMSWMAYETTLLGQNDQVIILIANIQRNRLRDDLGTFVDFGQLYRNSIASRNGVFLRSTGLTVHIDRAGLKQTRACRTRGHARLSSKIGIDSLAGVSSVDQIMHVGHQESPFLRAARFASRLARAWASRRLSSSVASILLAGT